MSQKYPEPIVCGLIIHNKKLLLLRSHKTRSKLTIPGGHLELGETLEEGLKREIKEETNINVKVTKLLTFKEFIFQKSYWKKKHFLFFYYLCSPSNHDIILNYEHQSYQWQKIEELLTIRDIDPFLDTVIKENYFHVSLLNS